MLPLIRTIKFTAQTLLLLSSASVFAYNNTPAPDNQNEGVLSFTSAQYSVLENRGTITVSVTRSSGDSGRVSVQLATHDGSALAGEDYSSVNPTLSWNNKETGAKFFSIPIKNDTKKEDNESFSVTLTTVTGGALLGGVQQTQITINDDDDAPPKGEGLLSDVAQNPVQLAMANSLDAINAAGSANDDLNNEIQYLLLAKETQKNAVAEALQQIAPEEFVAQSNLAIETSATQLRNISARLYALRDGVSCIDFSGLNAELNEQVFATSFLTPTSLCPERNSMENLPRLGFFVNGSFSAGDKVATGRSAGFEFDTTGITAGADYRLNANSIIGTAFGYAKTSAEFEQQNSVIDAKSYSLSLYGMLYEKDKFFVDAIYTYSRNKYDNQRAIHYTVMNREVDQIAYSDNKGEQHAFSATLGRYFHYKRFSFTPQIRYEYIDMRTDEATETTGDTQAAGSSLALRINKQKVRSSTLSFGSDVQYTLQQSWGLLVPQAHIHAIYEFDNDAHALTGQFLNASAQQSFQFLTDRPDRVYFNLGVGIAAQFAPGKMLYMNYEKVADLSHVNWYAINVGLRLAF